MNNLLIASMLLLMASLTFADETGGVFIGTDILTNVKYDDTPAGRYTMAHVGSCFGFYLPVKLPGLEYHYRVKASFHEIAQRNWELGELLNYPKSYLYDQHMSILNELMVGKEITLLPKYGILPQAGIGVLIDALYDNDGTGIKSVAHHCLFLDAGCAFRMHMKNVGVVVSTNYLFAVRPSWEGYTATNRFSTSLGIFK